MIDRAVIDDTTTRSLEKLNAEALVLRDVVNLIPKRCVTNFSAGHTMIDIP